MRGEYEALFGTEDTKQELPPRARRIPGHRDPERKSLGTTSACAENTAAQVGCGELSGNYLRVRGEYEIFAVAASTAMELPPRARRIPGHRDPERKSLGTTSACAENTAAQVGCGELSGNYLRVRGEYIDALAGVENASELPPRARRIRSGKDFFVVIRELPPRARRILFAEFVFGNSKGTTSACAENTVPQQPRHHPPRNYLRVRGEYLARPHLLGGLPELPPRARRIPIHNQNAKIVLGTTSACAENTGRRSEATL